MSAQTTINPRVVPMDAADLLNRDSREFLIIGGKDGVGKSSAIVSIARWVEIMTPKATFYIIDFENKLHSIIKQYGTEAPANIQYYQVRDMNEATEVLAEIIAKKKPGDWIAVESASRMWEKAQDLGYMAVTGQDKPQYMERRRKEKIAAVTPSPDQLWNITKGAHDRAFLDLLAEDGTVNVVITTTVAKPKADRGPIKESQARQEVRAEFGIDVGIEGAPRLPYYAETLLLLDRKDGKVSARILRDNLSKLDTPTITVAIEDRKSFARDLFAATRN